MATFHLVSKYKSFSLKTNSTNVDEEPNCVWMAGFQIFWRNQLFIELNAQFLWNLFGALPQRWLVWFWCITWTHNFNDNIEKLTYYFLRNVDLQQSWKRIWIRNMIECTKQNPKYLAKKNNNNHFKCKKKNTSKI